MLIGAVNERRRVKMPKPEWPGWFDGELTTREYALLLLVIVLIAQDFWVGTEPKLGDSKKGD